MGTPSGTIQTADVAVDMYMKSHGGTSCTWIHDANSFRHPRTAKPTVGKEKCRRAGRRTRRNQDERAMAGLAGP